MSWCHEEDGSLTVWMLGLSVAVLFLGGLSLDLWRAFAERRELAGIVDAAAVAGASLLDERSYRESGRVVLDPVAAGDVACRYLQDRGTSCEGVSATPDAITVVARREVPLTLLRVLAPLEDPLLIEVSAEVEPRLGAP